MLNLYQLLLSGIALVLPSLGPALFMTAVDRYQQQNLVCANGLFREAKIQDLLPVIQLLQME